MRSTSSAPRSAPSCSRPQAASSPARAAKEASSSRRRTDQRSGAGRQSRQGSESPAPAQETRIAVSLMSPMIGQISTGVPAPSARATVPWPPWETTSEAAGISWL